MQTEASEPVQSDPKKRKGIFFWLGRAILTMMILTLALVLLVHFPPIQKWGISRISNSLSKSLNSDVHIGGFDLHPVSDLTIYKIFISSPEHPGDTLIYAEKLHVDYKRIWDIFFRRITISQIGVDDGFLNIHRFAGDSLNNLDLALLRIMPARNPDKSDFVLDLKTLNARSLRVNVIDETFGTVFQMFFKRADVQFDTLDIIGKYIDIKDLDLDEPVIEIINILPMADRSTAIPGSDKLWSLDVDRWQMRDGKIGFDNRTNPRKIYTGLRAIDFPHLSLTDVDIRMDSLTIRGWNFSGNNIDIQLQHENGFALNTLKANHASVTDTLVSIDQLLIQTPLTRIQNSVRLSFTGYTDFQSFSDLVNIDVPAADIRLHMSDLLAIVPGLENLDFFKDNADKSITLQGRVYGHVNRLRILEMHAGIGSLTMTGDFRSRDLMVKGSQLISLDLEKSAFSAHTLKQIFPGMNVPPVLDKLGQINFAGKFDGYPDDFVAYGTFNTSLGRVKLDMNLNIVKGISAGKYSGSIALQDFNLGAFIGNKDVGLVNMSGRVIEGTGLNSETLNAEVTAQLTSLVYKGYTLRNARVDGHLKGKEFLGTLDINDPNVDIHFEGYVDVRDSLPKLDFISRIENVHFHELGLSKKAITLSGIFDGQITLGRLDEMSGSLHSEKISLSVDDDTYYLDDILFLAVVDTATNERLYRVNSKPLSGTISGTFDPLTLPNQIHHYLHTHYPKAIDAPRKQLKITGTQQLNWNLKIEDSGHWFALTGLQSLNIKNGATQGTINLDEQRITGNFDLPEIHYRGFNAYVTTVAIKENAGRTDFDLEVIAADIKEDFFFEDVLIKGETTNDSIRINFKTDHLADIIDKLDLDIVAGPEGSSWFMSVNPRRLVMLGENWKVPAGNIIEINKNSFSLQNVELVSGDQKIILDDIDRKGLEAYITGFDISYLNDLWINDKFQFSGLYTLDFEVDNLYDIQKMQTVLSIPELQVNKVPYGQLVLNAHMNDPKDSVKIDLVMLNGETSLTGKGAFLPPIKSIPKEKQNYLRLDLVANDFPLGFLEFLLRSNIRDTEGSVDMTLSLEGKTNALNPNGKGRVYNGSTTIDYLGVAYSFHDQAFTITENMIDLTGAKLYDVLGNSALVNGGISHRYLRNLGLNATITSSKILGLDVTSEENNVFYGKGIGSVFARFSGTVANPTMVINTTTAKGTHIYIPLSGATESAGNDFVVFLENGLLPVTNTTLINLGGINLTMNMTITEDAIVEIIFDDNTGEVLRGIGKGDLQLSMTRTGNFSMYGDYVIEQGDYLFTNFRVVRKPFELLRGGRIQWDGDPYNANINVQAKYKGLTASVYPFIQEYLTGNQGQSKLVDQARERTEIDLTMTLTGSLLHPDIAFDIAFPSLTGEIKGYTDSKLTTLKANDNAMNVQVMGLLITRSFLPASSGVGNLGISNVIDNTLSELISATLSSYLSGLLGDLIPRGEFLSSVDFQVGLDLPFTQGSVIDQSGELADLSATELEINLPLKFFNDRLSVNVGGNYVTGASLVDNQYLAGDVTFEYELTPDGRLKIRAYNRNTLTLEGRKNKVGVGVAYRREYDSFLEFLGKKKAKDEE